MREKILKEHRPYGIPENADGAVSVSERQEGGPPLANGVRWTGQTYTEDQISRNIANTYHLDITARDGD